MGLLLPDKMGRPSQSLYLCLCNSRNKFVGQGSRIFNQSNEVVYNVSHPYPFPKLMDVPEVMLYRRDVRSN